MKEQSGFDQTLRRAEASLAEVYKKCTQEFILQQEVYQIGMKVLKQPLMEDNHLFQNLLKKLELFFILSERVRHMPQKYLKLYRPGFNFQYRIELHKCLKNLMLKIVSQKDRTVRDLQVKEVYGWYLKKLNQIGDLPRVELLANLEHINPTRDSIKSDMRKVVARKAQHLLVNQAMTREETLRMFDQPKEYYQVAERTEIKEIPTAESRLEKKKNRVLKHLEQATEKIREDEAMLI